MCTNYRRVQKIKCVLIFILTGERASLCSDTRCSREPHSQSPDFVQEGISAATTRYDSLSPNKRSAFRIPESKDGFVELFAPCRKRCPVQNTTDYLNKAFS